MLTSLNQISPASGNPLSESRLEGLGIRPNQGGRVIHTLAYIPSRLATPFRHPGEQLPADSSLSGRAVITSNYPRRPAAPSIVLHSRNSHARIRLRRFFSSTPARPRAGSYFVNSAALSC